MRGTGKGDDPGMLRTVFDKQEESLGKRDWDA